MKDSKFIGGFDEASALLGMMVDAEDDGDSASKYPSKETKTLEDGAKVVLPDGRRGTVVGQGGAKTNSIKVKLDSGKVVEVSALFLSQGKQWSSSSVDKSASTQAVYSAINSWWQHPTLAGIRGITGMVRELEDDEANAVGNKYSRLSGGGMTYSGEDAVTMAQELQVILTDHLQQQRGKSLGPGVRVASAQRGKGEVVKVYDQRDTALVRWSTGGQSEEPVEALKELRGAASIFDLPVQHTYDSLKAAVTKMLEDA